MTDKVMPATALTRGSQADMAYTSYFEVLPGGIRFEDIFYPQFWRHHKRIRPMSIIRLRAEDGSFDVDVVVRTQSPSGLVVEFRSGRVPAGIDANMTANAALLDATKVRMAPIAEDGKPRVRVQFLPKTKWRLIGVDGSEISRDHATELEAQTAMANYLAAMLMRNPTEEELHAHAQAKLTAVTAA